MTTIAYKDGILAADTQLTDGNMKYLCRKIEVLTGGEVVSSAGNEDDFYIWRDWYYGDKKKAPKLHKTFCLFMINLEGKPVRFNANCVEVPITDPLFALGSGEPMARAAMIYGLTAKQAVLFASEVDVNTNNIVDTYDSKTKTFSLTRFPKYRKK